MREIRQSGSEGGAWFNPMSLPLFALFGKHPWAFGLRKSPILVTLHLLRP